MSKADHALTTSTKGMHARRGALSAGRASSPHRVSQIDALPLLPKGIPSSRDRLELQRAASLLYEAVSARVERKTTRLNATRRRCE
jgi:hypothetical protein